MGLIKRLTVLFSLKIERVYMKSNAALRVCMNLNGLWKVFIHFYEFFPPLFRDFFYDIVAKNRYKWFGKQESCMLPTTEMKKRFLD